VDRLKPNKQPRALPFSSFQFPGQGNLLREDYNVVCGIGLGNENNIIFSTS